jgi:hypothetical protein
MTFANIVHQVSLPSKWHITGRTRRKGNRIRVSKGFGTTANLPIKKDSIE